MFMYYLGLVERRKIVNGLRAQKNAFEFMLRVRCWAPHVWSLEDSASTLAWDDSPLVH